MRNIEWNELEKELAGSADRVEKIGREVEKEILELNLSALRESFGKSQVEIAKATEMSQGEVSRVEQRSDHLVSTLRRIVEALGGELEVLARFGDRTVRLKGV